MVRTKDETISIRTSAQIKELLRQAAEREHRSVASIWCLGAGRSPNPLTGLA